MTSHAKKLSTRNGKKFLQLAFQEQQEVFSRQLQLAAKSITHDGKYGGVTEKHFIKILRQYLPNRYSVDSAIIIDCNGKTSDQIDVVIYDRQYTPTLLDQQNHKYVPAEAVYAVFEVKPSIDGNRLKYASKKAASVRKLKRTSVNFRTATGVGQNRKTYIIAGIVAPKCGWAKGFDKAFLKIHSSLKARSQIDCGLALDTGCFDVYSLIQKQLTIPSAIKNGSCGDDDNLIELPLEPEIRSQKNCLVVFLFRLLRLLQFIGTVPAIDWEQYARNFNKELKELL